MLEYLIYRIDEFNHAHCAYEQKGFVARFLYLILIQQSIESETGQNKHCQCKNDIHIS